VTQLNTEPRRRGRPRTVPGSGADPREEILTSAAHLFSRKGMNATRITDIAAAVGVAPPTIYYHFDNLDAIADELLRFVVEESAAFAVHEVERSGSYAERLTSLIHQHVSRLTSAPYDLWFVAGLTEADIPRFPAVATHAQAWRDAVASIVQEGITAGEFRDVDPRLAVAMISGLVYGALQLRHEVGSVDATEVAAFVAHSLAPAPRKRR
jgi:AcrR family transcriptional regulator